MTTESSATEGRKFGRAARFGGQVFGADDAGAGRWAGLTEPGGLVTELLARISLTGWTVHRRDGRDVVVPATPVNRVQGWKLHVSATVLSAPEVLAACAPPLVETGTAFEYVATLPGLAAVNGPWAPRFGGGKFLTAYPATDELFRELAKRLDEATVGMVGPAILSDQPYRAGGVVHYRYGAFTGVDVLDNDGGRRRCVVGPFGSLVEDRCEAAFRPPPWVEMPFDSSPEWRAPAVAGPDRPAGGTGSRWSVASMQAMGTGPIGPIGPAGSTGMSGPVDPAGPTGVLIGGRYAVTTAIRQANKGGVYRARDLRTGVEVLIKEARPHVGTDARGRDVRDLLGHEARVLRHLGPLGVAPRPLREFVQGDHRFLVEELLPGKPLRLGLRDFPEAGPGGLDVAALLGVLGRLARLVRTVHSVGVVLRKLTPDTVLLLPDGELRLVDLGMAALRTGGPDDWACLDLDGPDVLGFVAPEQVRGAPPDGAADLFGLGMLALHLVGRTTSVRSAGPPRRRSLEERVNTLVEPSLGGRPIPTALRRVVTGLLRNSPADRIGLDEVIALCEAAPTDPQRRGTAGGVDADAELPTLPEESWRDLVGGLIARLAVDGDRDRGTRSTGRGSVSSGSGRGIEPCTVRHGIAGPISVLTRLVSGGSPIVKADPADPISPPGRMSEPGTVLRAGRVLDALLDRLTHHLDQEPHRLPGLYAGSAGAAWALCDAGRLLGRPYLVDRAVELALRLPVVWPDPGMSQGVAGLGTCLLHLWQHTYLPALRDRLTAAAGHLLDTVDRSGPMVWTVDPSFDSALAGHRSYGFAHGTAGIGAFLLSAGHLLGRRDLTAAAVRCADTLLDAARYVGDAALWPSTPTASDTRAHWYDGSAGVGTFLCRLYVRTGEARYLAASVAAARAVMRARWTSGTTYWHGLPGDGDFLLDLARATGDGRYARWAEALAVRLWALRVYRDGVALLPDDSDRRIDSGFGTGLAGQLAFLLRLRDGGPRLFHPDPDVTPRRDPDLGLARGADLPRRGTPRGPGTGTGSGLPGIAASGSGVPGIAASGSGVPLIALPGTALAHRRTACPGGPTCRC
ncbi:class IV lanthionine synthetase LanL [Plantactinospora sp. S1510]|uniref:Class IV lanthionine synthetase LanL n=1 Tax=Plantactinospora alkalitolerans TaxID=2789879 RepID=A0ABS0H365_9ACTN|nr:class IV lanthionine synthetase LanL [Plantactinospora alkalitolerans]MBF9132907.1 class IV lanthionine synthetase LanL [Plantactinospora alkalitolerans]